MTSFQHLLVPLDGSHLAETILSPAITLARVLGARVTLFHVLERRAPGTVHGDRHLREGDEAASYLDGIAQRFTDAGIPCEAHLHRNPAADIAGEILDHAEELAADLIMIATHGRGGLRTLLFGSIAQQVLRRGTLPVLVVQPRRGPEGDWAPRRLLVPLSGRPEAEPALPLATELARVLGAELRLVVVVPTADTVSGDQAATATLSPTAMAGVLELEAKSVSEYLAGVLATLGQEATGEVRRGRPAETLAHVADEWGADLVVLTTHARAGLDALLSASVGARLVSLLDRPLLLMRVRERGVT